MIRQVLSSKMVHFRFIRKRVRFQNSESILPNALKGEVGIAHTRWATHGEANDTNAHPHSSADESIAIVHNGIIENAKRLRKHLKRLDTILSQKQIQKSSYT